MNYCFTLSRQGEILTRVPLSKAEVLLGSDENADIRIQDPLIEPLHARLVQQPQGYEIHLLTRNPAMAPLLSGGEETEQAMLTIGDRVMLGPFELSLAGKAREPEPTRTEKRPPRVAYLQFLSGKHLGRVVALTQSRTRLGNASGGWVVIERQNDDYFLLCGKLQAMPSIHGIDIPPGRHPLSGGEQIRLSDQLEVEFFFQDTED